MLELFSRYMRTGVVDLEVELIRRDCVADLELRSPINRVLDIDISEMGTSTIPQSTMQGNARQCSRWLIRMPEAEAAPLMMSMVCSRVSEQCILKYPWRSGVCVDSNAYIDVPLVLKNCRKRAQHGIGVGGEQGRCEEVVRVRDGIGNVDLGFCSRWPGFWSRQIDAPLLGVGRWKIDGAGI